MSDNGLRESRNSVSGWVEFVQTPTPSSEPSSSALRAVGVTQEEVNEVRQLWEAAQKKRDEVNALMKQRQERDDRLETKITIQSSLTPPSMEAKDVENIEVVQLLYVVVSDEFQKMLTNMKNLEDLSLLSCKGSLNLMTLDSLKNLRRLNLSGLVDVSNFTVLKRLPNLTHLWLNEAFITDENIGELSEAGKMEELSIEACCCVRDISALASLKSLRSLNASDCGRLSKLGSIGGLPTLTRLDLSRTRIDDDAIQELGRNRSLHELHLEGCKDAKNFTPLGNILTLNELDLRQCAPTAFPNFADIPFLEVLLLDSTGATDDLVKNIGACRRIRQLGLSECCGITDVSLLGNVKTLEALDLSSCASLTTLGFQGRLPALRRLMLLSTSLSEDAVKELRAMDSLRSVDVRGCSLNDGQLTEILGLKLEGFHVDSVPLSAWPTIQFAMLQRISMGGSSVTNAVVRTLSEGTNLKSLHIDDCEALTDITPLGQTQSLDELRLTDCKSLKNISAFLEASALRKLLLSGSFVTDEMIAQLKVSKTLSFLYIESRRVQTLTDLSGVILLSTLTLCNCEKVDNVGALADVSFLNTLSLIEMDFEMASLLKLSKAKSLDSLRIDGYHSREIALKDLARLNIRKVIITNSKAVRHDDGAAARFRQMCVVLRDTPFLGPAGKDPVDLGVDVA